MRTVKSYRDLDVWRSGMDLAAECYRLAKLMPKAEELAEAETFLLLCVRTELLPMGETESAMAIADRLGRQLNALRSKLAKPSS